MRESELIDLALELSAIRSSENISLELKKNLSRLLGKENISIFELVWKRSDDGYEIIVHELHCRKMHNFSIEENALFHDCFIKKDLIRVENGNDHRESLIFPIIFRKEVVQIVSLEIPPASVDVFSRIRKTIELYNNLLVVLNEKDRDYLTSLYNRESFNRIANLICNQKYEFKKDPPQPHSYLAILDIDHFKSVNDEHGHLIGDEVLIKFSQVLRDSIRREDYCFRYGGEEFILIFKTGKPSDAHLILDRFRNAVESTTFPRVEKITVSIGFVEIREKTDPFILSDMADRALYYAKEKGRNQVRSYDILLEKGAIQSSDSPDSYVYLWN